MFLLLCLYKKRNLECLFAAIGPSPHLRGSGPICCSIKAIVLLLSQRGLDWALPQISSDSPCHIELESQVQFAAGVPHSKTSPLDIPRSQEK